jgi:hypothetical protein
MPMRCTGSEKIKFSSNNTGHDMSMGCNKLKVKTKYIYTYAKTYLKSITPI